MSDIFNNTLTNEKLSAIAAENFQIYQSNTPFPHIVIDNFFTEAVLDAILKEFPTPEQIDWIRFQNDKEVKLATKHEQDLGTETRAFIHYLNSATFLDFLTTLTGIKNLISDPYLEGGGLHQIKPGGKLGIHADFNIHRKYKLDRRLNLLLYLNKDWREEYGGHLELWDSKVKNCERKILPIFNRVVIFNTTDFTYHGHPEPLTCPTDRTRKSLALYYYTNGRPKQEVSSKHKTLFKERPGEKFADTPLTMWQKVKNILAL